jgi:hypothetical protein
MPMPFPPLNPFTDGQLGFNGTFAQLQSVSTAQMPVGTLCYTTDMGSVRWSGTAWQMDNAVDGLVAHAGGGQGSATLITASMARFATVATAGDSSILPVSKPGMNITVTNAGVASMNVFPAVGDAINALGANAAFALGVGKSVTFVCYTAGQLHTWPLVP